MFEKDEPYCKEVMSETYSYLYRVMLDDVSLSINDVNEGFNELNKSISKTNETMREYL